MGVALSPSQPQETVSQVEIACGQSEKVSSCSLRFTSLYLYWTLKQHWVSLTLNQVTQAGREYY